MKQKKSFLDKITGSSSSEEVDNIVVENDDIDTDVIENDDPISIEEKEEEQESPVWQEESEGQLTVDVYQTDSDIVIKSTIAGVTADNLDVNITNDMVTIKGKRSDKQEVETKDYYYQECYWGSFSRSIILPVDVEAERAEADLKNGILTIRLPKAEKVKTKKIKVVG
ncbi:Hsp20/alpha crystallin family protein [bacterium]|nr:MAG: Hsp20/alpha crystallin family protein [bacterium]